MIIFVFDPLAILLFVAVNSLIRKEQDEEAEKLVEMPKVAKVRIKVKEPVPMELPEEIPEEPEEIIKEDIEKKIPDDIPEKIDDTVVEEKEEKETGEDFFVHKGYTKERHKKMIDELKETKTEELNLTEKDIGIILETDENPPEPNGALKKAAKEVEDKKKVDEKVNKKKVYPMNPGRRNKDYKWASSNFKLNKKKDNQTKNYW